MFDPDDPYRAKSRSKAQGLIAAALLMASGTAAAQMHPWDRDDEPAQSPSTGQEKPNRNDPIRFGNNRYKPPKDKAKTQRYARKKAKQAQRRR
jgi:hypothetical protein